MFKGRFQIRGDRPLSEFATGLAQAFAAEEPQGFSDGLMALIINPGIPFRFDAARAMRGADATGLMTLIDHGVIDWPAYGRKVAALIYRRPAGVRVMAGAAAEAATIGGADLIRKAVRPMASALRELALRGVTHRAIRPTNMYWSDGTREAITLGDYLAAPPALEQPAAYETIESALAQPAGRGDGTAADDLYALGASLMTLLLGRNALAGASPQAILRAKINLGSYEALLGAERVPPHLTELLQGLLQDDPAARWTLDQLEKWLGGKWRPPIQPTIEKRVMEAFPFNGHDYFSPRELAMGFCAAWGTAAAAISDGGLEQWMRRILGARKSADAVAAAVRDRREDKGDARMADDELVCRACLILDPAAPLRYKTMSFMPDGIGALLAMTIANGGDVNPVAELFLRDAQAIWLDMQGEPTPEGNALNTLFRAMREHLLKTSVGDGIERVLYRLNPSIPCQSAQLASEYVLELRDLLPALNTVATRAEAKTWPIDRHVAAFVAARTPLDIGRYLVEVADPSPQRAMLGGLALMAAIQSSQGQKGLVALAGWIARAIGPVLYTYRSRKRRQEIERELPEAAQDGELGALLRLIDDPSKRSKDQLEYARAGDEWHRLAEAIADIDHELSGQGNAVARTARTAASAIAIGIAIVAVYLIAVGPR